MVRKLFCASRPFLGRPSLQYILRNDPWAAYCHRSFSATSPRRDAAASQATGTRQPLEYMPTSRHPSARPIDTRKSQLIRTYTSLLRTTPLLLFFQHSNLTAVEWAAVRRELKKAVMAVHALKTTDGPKALDLGPRIQLQVLRTNMFNVAFKIFEFYRLGVASCLAPEPWGGQITLAHDLSLAAYNAIRDIDVPANSVYAQAEPLMVGPLAALTMPLVSPALLAAAMGVLAPVPGRFPAPTRKKSPGYYEPACQSGLAKLLLVGGRVEGKIFDQSGVNWVGGIDGDRDNLLTQLVGTLQSVGLGVTGSLEGGSWNLWLALERRKCQLEASLT